MGGAGGREVLEEEVRGEETSGDAEMAESERVGLSGAELLGCEEAAEPDTLAPHAVSATSPSFVAKSPRIFF